MSGMTEEGPEIQVGKMLKGEDEKMLKL